MSHTHCAASTNHNWSLAYQKVAVFIDIENFAGSCDMLGLPIDLTPIFTEVKAHYGFILIKRSCGDVCSLPNKRFNSYEIRRHLQSQQVAHLDLPHRQSSYSKNAADMALVVNAVSLINQRPDITHIVVVSGDRDFVPLYNHAREAGKTVIGVGASRAVVAEDTINACDEYLFQDELAPHALAVKAWPPNAAATPDGAPRTQPPAHSITAEPAESSTLNEKSVHCLMATLRHMQKAGVNLVASRVANEMKKLFPEFDVKSLFGSFRRFCNLLESAGHVELVNRNEANFTLRSLHPSGPQTTPDAQGLQPNTPCAEPLAVTAATTENSVRGPDLHPTATETPQTGSPQALLAQYQHWVQSKLKITALPTRPVRESIYDHMVKLLQRHGALGLPLRLKKLAYLVAIELPGTPDAQMLAFRIGFGLFKGQVAFDVRPTENAYDPEILGVVVEREQLDGCFALNLLTSFRNDSKNHGLPFHPEVFQWLLTGAPSLAGTQTETATPAPANAYPCELAVAGTQQKEKHAVRQLPLLETLPA